MKINKFVKEDDKILFFGCRLVKRPIQLPVDS